MFVFREEDCGIEMQVLRNEGASRDQTNNAISDENSVFSVDDVNSTIGELILILIDFLLIMGYFSKLKA